MPRKFTLENCIDYLAERDYVVISKKMYNDLLRYCEKENKGIPKEIIAVIFFVMGIIIGLVL